MSYYGMGDYYRGDYYRGDPFLGSLVGSLAKRALPAIGRGLGLIKRPPKPLSFPTGVAVGTLPSVISGRFGPPPPGQQKTPGFKGFRQRLFPGGATGYEGVRRRRMNPANPKALRRALRRVSGFAKLAQRAKRDIGKAATAVGVNRGRGSRRGGTVVVNPTAARVRNE